MKITLVIDEFEFVFSHIREEHIIISSSLNNFRKEVKTLSAAIDACLEEVKKERTRTFENLRNNFTEYIKLLDNLSST